LRLLDRGPTDERGGAGRLEPEHPRQPIDYAGGPVVAKARPAGRDVACVADWDREHVRCASEVIADLERRGLLARKAVGVDGVDKGQRVIVASDQLANDRQGAIEG